MKHTPGPWKYKQSETKNAYNVVGTVLGGKYKIARCPYIVMGNNIIDEREKKEAEHNAALIAADPDLLAACIEFVRKVESKYAKSIASYQQMKAAIEKTANIQPPCPTTNQ